MLWVKSELTDAQLWESVKDKYTDWDSRFRAVIKITNQSILEKIALEDKHSYIREEAVKKLTNQSILEQVALEDKSWGVREIAVPKITNQSVLEKIALEDVDLTVRKVAVNKITNVESLKQLALKAKKDGKQGTVTLAMKRLIELGVI